MGGVENRCAPSCGERGGVGVPAELNFEVGGGSTKSVPPVQKKKAIE
jgi:hypothetical protein